ncbi:hypothetical protein B0H17DRAFT_1211560 [Mycena rosella]|uniref:Uncharacterized protein n=1 Tax=Mycena rosella TaxID=1033263 RepID=A0AAD7G7B0_MYCRO|nr:hypothetical protein B0H17DRAFT_1211560 [Mycena rosella]
MRSRGVWMKLEMKMQDVGYEDKMRRMRRHWIQCYWIPRAKPESSAPLRLSKRSSPPNSPNRSLQLLILPPELLTLIALHLATAPPNLGPLAALLPLLCTCRTLHARPGFGGNPVLWGRIGQAKFVRTSLASYPASDESFGKSGARSSTPHMRCVRIA